MARTTKEIQEAMTAELQVKLPELSTSKVAEWRLWTYIVATAIRMFELILDLFRNEIEEIAEKITPGTPRWYVDMCYRFQNGHKLLYDDKTGLLYYAEDVPATQIIKQVAKIESRGKLLLKVATTDADGFLVPLTQEQLYNFNGYIEAIHFAGLEVVTMSLPADLIRYDIKVYYDPVIPASIVQDNVLAALEAFKLARTFDAVFYSQKLVEAVLSAKGVVTAKLNGIEHKAVTDEGFAPVDVVVPLAAGYYNYDESSIITMQLVKQINDEPED